MSDDLMAETKASDWTWLEEERPGQLSQRPSTTHSQPSLCTSCSMAHSCHYRGVHRYLCLSNRDPVLKDSTTVLDALNWAWSAT